MGMLPSLRTRWWKWVEISDSLRSCQSQMTVASMALLSYWLSRADEVPLAESDYSGDFSYLGARVNVGYEILRRLTVNLKVNYYQHAAGTVKGTVPELSASGSTEDWNRLIAGIYFKYVFNRMRISL